MIYSRARISDCLIDNERNNLNVSISLMNNVEAGFVNMNYQSQMDIRNSTFRGLVAQTASFLRATGQSSISITNNTLMINMTSADFCVQAYSPALFVMKNISMIMANGSTVQNMLSSSQFQSSESRIYPHGQRERESDADGSEEGRASILIVDAGGRIDDTLFLGDVDGRENHRSSSEAAFAMLAAGRTPMQDLRALRITGGLSSVQVSGSTFANLTATSAAAIKLESTG